jgi:hypothetical protein
MVRLLLALAICLAIACPAAVARPAYEGPLNAHAAKRVPNAGSNHRPRLRITASKRPIERFLTSALQVTGLPSSFTVHHCRRRSSRAVDCAVTVPGRAQARMRAKLLGRGGGRVQLYVLGASPLA